MIQYLKITKDSKRTIVVGDIHGCFCELEALLEKIKFSDQDILISVGDMVDRGLYSWETAHFFKNRDNAYSVLGNHERRIAGVIRGTSRAAWSQLHSLSKINKSEHNYWASWFETLPAVIETNHVIVTHGRLDPEKSLESQDPYFTCAVGGNAVKIDLNDDGIPLWFGYMKEKTREKPLCIGHRQYRSIELVQGKLFALDTYAVKNGSLSCAVFPEGKIIQVSATKNYYELSRNEWLGNDIEPEKIPLHKIIKYSTTKAPHHYEQAVLEKYNQYLQKHNLEKRIHDLRNRLITEFGILPNDEIAKRDYFKEIVKRFPNMNMGLARTLLSHKNNLLEYFFKAYKKLNLKAALNLVLDMEKSNEENELLF